MKSEISGMFQRGLESLKADVEAGSGDTVDPGDMILLHFSGWLHDSDSPLGAWEPARRQLRLARSLVTGQPWGTVLEHPATVTPAVFVNWIVPVPSVVVVPWTSSRAFEPAR